MHLPRHLLWLVIAGAPGQQGVTGSIGPQGSAGVTGQGTTGTYETNP